MGTPLTIELAIHVRRRAHGAKDLSPGKPVRAVAPAGRVPRLARLMALAIHFDDLIRTRRVKNYAQLARLGRVTRSRISQIVSLALLAPDIQEELLFLPAIKHGKSRLSLRRLLPIAATADWAGQRRSWRDLYRDRQHAT